MKLLGIILLIFSPLAQSSSSLYVCKAVKAVIYSEAPIENIEATSVKGFSVIDLNKSEVQFNIPIKSFQFKKSLMQEHFNENYLESDKYPNAQFKGKIRESIDPTKEGNYPVTVTGDLDVHGVKKNRTIPGVIRIKDNSVTITSKFNVLCKDHNIDIPQLVFQNIAESIQVTVSGTFSAYKKP
ncbi:MAG: YceI family protein [Sphingobacteriaceae bacterium]|jgi:polyisoprenoid-binding protein YceI|nr:YceI family protein [Sphingobacteriaceae bacterium]